MSKVSDFFSKLGHKAAEIAEAIGHFFSHLFGQAGKVAQEVLEETSDIVKAALPIVAQVAQVAAQFSDPAGIFAGLVKFLPTVVTDAKAVQAFADANKDAPINSVLHNVAVLITQHTDAGSFASRATNELDTAVQFAYSLYKKQQAAAAAPVAPVVK